MLSFLKGAIFLLAISHGVFSAKKIGTSCKDQKTKQWGVCKLAQDCPDAKERSKNGEIPTLCDIHMFTIPVVCCLGTTGAVSKTPDETTTIPKIRNRISVEKCEEYSKLSRECEFNSNPLIVGGVEALRGEFPFMVSVGDKDGFFCAGSLISEDFVLTAAHCTKDRRLPTKVRVGHHKIFGEENIIEVNIRNIIVHPEYNETKKYYDISLLRLEKRISLNKSIKPICLWNKFVIDFNKTVATGWGATAFGERSSNVLRKVELDIFDNAKCQAIYKNIDDLPIGIVSSQLCAGDLAKKKDTCQGDSGGPVFVYNKNNNCVHYIIGATSFGDICGQNPGVYTRISEFLPWIENTVWPS